MSQSNDTPKPTALEDHRPLADSELDAVSGGTADTAAPKLLEACCKGTHIPNVIIE
ncbi:hypothetical protein [Bradyrhizobium sp. Ash2021]|uniref:hypothetical protein n=1 Tax=Bradyrhizobium sp. Ash2021 TaxID=2954771 RepID=UPI0028150434|nr:hypothetical protein [Bradyrhizobium sp. Ash2021]WMT72255.1 type VI secretion system tube protein Hcp [Bradyrhizobium sp. Ash2021]